MIAQNFITDKQTLIGRLYSNVSSGRVENSLICKLPLKMQSSPPAYTTHLFHWILCLEHRDRFSDSGECYLLYKNIKFYAKFQNLSLDYWKAFEHLHKINALTGRITQS